MSYYSAPNDVDTPIKAARWTQRRFIYSSSELHRVCNVVIVQLNKRHSAREALHMKLFFYAEAPPSTKRRNVALLGVSKSSLRVMPTAM